MRVFFLLIFLFVTSFTYGGKIQRAFDALKEYTEKRIEHIKELTEDIKKLETEDDIKKFTRGENSGIGRAHKNILYTKYVFRLLFQCVLPIA